MNNPLTAASSYRLAIATLARLPDGCAIDLDELAQRIGADKLELIRWMRADIALARLIALKVITRGQPALAAAAVGTARP